MFTVYSDLGIFESIILDNNKFSNWNAIFSKHSDICLDISDEDLQIIEKDTDEPVFQFLHANGGRPSIIALHDYFESIEDDKSQVVQQSRSTFFLDYPDQDVLKMQSDYGVLVLNLGVITDNELTIPSSRTLPKGEIIEQDGRLGWMELLHIDVPPSNSLVISDPYLLKDTDIGKKNILSIINKLLPQVLETDYHILILSEDYDRSADWKQETIKSLQDDISALRPYAVVTEVIFAASEHLHKRRLMLNYINASCDKGFCVFKIEDDKTIRSENDIVFNRIFSNLNNQWSESEYSLLTRGLRLIKTETDKSGKVVNRLINDV